MLPPQWASSPTTGARWRRASVVDSASGDVVSAAQPKNASERSEAATRASLFMMEESLSFADARGRSRAGARTRGAVVRARELAQHPAVVGVAGLCTTRPLPT